MAKSPAGPVPEWGATTRAPRSTSALCRNVTVSLAIGVWVLTTGPFQATGKGCCLWPGIFEEAEAFISTQIFFFIVEISVLLLAFKVILRN